MEIEFIDLEIIFNDKPEHTRNKMEFDNYIKFNSFFKTFLFTFPI